MDKFDKFSRDILRRASQPVIIPEAGSVFDYGVDCKAGQFVKWSEKTTDKARTTPSSYIVIPEVRSAEDDVPLEFVQVLRYIFFWKFDTPTPDNKVGPHTLLRTHPPSHYVT